MGALTVDVALALVRLRDEQVRHMPSNVVLIADSVATKDLLQSAPKSMTHTTTALGSSQNLHPSIYERPITILPLDHADHLGGHLALILQPAHLLRRQDAICRIRHGI